MSRFYIGPENIKDNSIYIDGNEAHHVLDVMRLKEGDEVTVFDGLGNEYKGKISEVKRKSLLVSIENKKKTSVLNINITLAQAIPRLEKMDYIIQKCAELGTTSIIPMITERTVVRIPGPKQEKRRARWEKIAKEASKQCGRSDIMEIKEISNFKTLIKSSQGYALKIMPSLTGDKKQLSLLVSGRSRESAIIFIGPEGGFSPAEIKLAEDNKVNLISLGPYTLRTDTAAITAVSILNYAFGEV